MMKQNGLKLDGSLGLVELDNREVEQVEGGVIGAVIVGGAALFVGGMFLSLLVGQDPSDGNLTRID